MKNPAKLFTIITASCVFMAAVFTACDLYFDTESDSTTQSEVSVSFETTEGDTLSPDTETTLEETTEETTAEVTTEEITAEVTTEEITETTAPPETTVHTHEFSVPLTVKEPSCEVEGSAQKECACGEIVTQPIPALGHKVEKLSGKPASCQSEGLTEGEKCSVCEKILKKQEIIPITQCEFSDTVCKNCGRIDPNAVTLSAPYAGLYRADTLKCLFSVSPDKKIPQASLTKMITACVAIENMPLDYVIKIGTEQSLVPKNSSLCYVYKGQRVKLKDLLTGMLLCSGNDAAYAVAANVARYKSQDVSMTDREAIDYFCSLMNDYAAKIGAKDTCFKTPDGFDEEGQYSTVNDLALITAHAMKNETIAEIASTHYTKIIFESGETAKWTNTNELINPKSKYYTDCVTGFKTGGTVEAGKCLSATFTVDGVEYIAIVMGCKDNDARYENILKLINSIK